MKFQHAYYHSMDRASYVPSSEAVFEDLQVGSAPKPQEVIKTKMQVGDIGFGSNPFVHPIQGIQARLKEGVGYIDIPFFGHGKGNKERYTPESVSLKERKDIRQLAEINEAKLSTHASTGIQGLAGYTQQGFVQEQREATLREIRKAIDFASDIQGGAVVFHTGEWPRPFSEQKWNEDKMFMHYPEEEKEAILHMVDARHGEIVGAVRKSVDVFEPQWAQAEKEYVDENGHEVRYGDYIDFRGNFIDIQKAIQENDYLTLLRRRPLWDPEREEFKTVRLTWDDFEERAKKSGRLPEEEYLLTKWTEQLLRGKGSSMFYSQYYERYVEQQKSLNEALQFYTKLEEQMPEEEKWKLMTKKYHNLGQDLHRYVDPMEMSIPDALRAQLKETEMQLKHIHEASSSFDTETEVTADRLKHMKPIADYGMDKSADTVARAGEIAWQKTRQKNTERPIYVSPESYLPGFFGSHPDEMGKLIDMSRDKMVNILTGEKHQMSQDEAQKLANEHIKGTLDVGHFNLWRQYFKAEPGESPDQTDQRFNKWYLGKVDNLVKSGKIGQVHLTDNMGYDDEHLAPGEGSVPIKEIMQIIDDAGVKDVIVEAGSFNAQRIVGDTLSYFGSPVYAVSRGPSFAQFHEQHFGYHGPPMYIVGAYSPSNDWKLWSDVQLE